MCTLEFKMITCLVVVISGTQGTPQIKIRPMQMDGARISVPEIVFPYYVVLTFTKLAGEVNYMRLSLLSFYPSTHRF